MAIQFSDPSKNPKQNQFSRRRKRIYLQKEREANLFSSDYCFNMLHTQIQTNPIQLTAKTKTQQPKNFKKAKQQNWKLKREEHLQIENYSPVAAENGGRVREQRIDNAKIASVNVNSVHDGILVHVQDCSFSRTVQQNPTPRRLLLHGHHRLWVHRHHFPISSHIWPSPKPNLTHIPHFQFSTNPTTPNLNYNTI